MATIPKRRKVSSKALQQVLHTGGISIKGLADLLRKLHDVDAADVLEASRWDTIIAQRTLATEERNVNLVSCRVCCALIRTCFV